MANDTAASEPILIAGHWPGLWEADLDAAVMWNDGYAYFFKGDSFFPYDVAKDSVAVVEPINIADGWPGLWTSGIDAAVLWNNGFAYFFKGDSYIPWHVEKREAYLPPRKILQPSGGWPGLWGSNIDAAVMWNNGYAYFFQGNNYLRYHVEHDKAEGGGLTASDPDYFQAYAYDFGHTEGGDVRAARAGTVLEIAKNVTKNTSNGDPGGPGDGRGNYVLIRHADNTVAEYAHLLYENVYVNPGDSVVQGQPIAWSGNTGNSTAPHLHFHVRMFESVDAQTYGKDYGPTVLVEFEDANHRRWQPRSGDVVQSNNS